MSKLTQNKNGSLSYETGDNTPKKKIERKPRNLHKCSEKEQLDRMRLILVGNGNPKTGLVFLVESSIEHQKIIMDDISSIKSDIKTALESAGTATRAIEMYKAEEISKDTTKKDIEDRAIVAKNLALTRSRDTWYKIFTILGLAIAIYFGVRNNKIPAQLEATKEELNTKIEQVDGVSKVTRGGYVKYNDMGMSDSIKLY
jgi:hypothetical protein